MERHWSTPASRRTRMATAVTLNVAGVTDINTAAQDAPALRPTKVRLQVRMVGARMTAKGAFQPFTAAPRYLN